MYDRAGRSPAGSAAATFGIVVLSAACLYWAKPVLVPTAIAVILAVLLTPIVVWFQHRGLNRGAAVGLAVGMTVIIMATVSWVLATQLVALADELPKYQANITRKIASLREQTRSSLVLKWQQFLENVSAEATKPATASGDPSETPNITSSSPRLAVPVQVVDDRWHWENLSSIGVVADILEPIAIGGLVLVLVIYMLIRREDVRNRLLCLVGDGQMTRTTRAIDDAGRRVSRFLLMQFFLNTSFGVVIGTALFLLGLPYAVFWGIWAAFMRYIPLIGPWILAAFPIALSLLTAEGWHQPLAITAMFVVAEVLVNLVIEPRLYGQSIGVSEGALLVAIAFWTWLWGVPGLMLAAPLTVCLVVLGKHVPALKVFDIILGDEPTMTKELQFYQRLLARDQDEASAILGPELAQSPPAQVYDHFCISALVSANRDAHDGLIDDSEEARIATMIADIVEEHSPASELEADYPEASSSRMIVLGLPARSKTDEVALGIFQRVIDPKMCDLQVLSRDHLVSQVADEIEERSAAALCIASLPPGGVAPVRLLCKRLRARFPKLKIIVARWGDPEDGSDDQHGHFQTAGATLVSESIEQTCAQLIQMARQLNFQRSDSTETPDTDVPTVSSI